MPNVGVMCLLIIVVLNGKSKTSAEKQKLPFATKCIKNLHFSLEELQQFDTEMLETPRALIQTNSRVEHPVRITEHYIAAFLSI